MQHANPHHAAPEAVPYPSEPYPWIELLQLGTKGLLALGQWQDMASSHAVCEICTPKKSMMYMNLFFISPMKVDESNSSHLGSFWDLPHVKTTL